MTWASVPISRADLQLKLTESNDELRNLSLLTLRTTLLSAIPRVFEDRLSEDGLLETIQLFSSASRDDILHFLNITEPATARQDELPTTTPTYSEPHITYHMRLEHMERKRKGKWEESATETL